MHVDGLLALVSIIEGSKATVGPSFISYACALWVSYTIEMGANLGAEGKTCLYVFISPYLSLATSITIS